jgi:hypothetical protein
MDELTGSAVLKAMEEGKICCQYSSRGLFFRVDPRKGLQCRASTGAWVESKQLSASELYKVGWTIVKSIPELEQEVLQIAELFACRYQHRLFPSDTIEGKLRDAGLALKKVKDEDLQEACDE